MRANDTGNQRVHRGERVPGQLSTKGITAKAEREARRGPIHKGNGGGNERSITYLEGIDPISDYFEDMWA